VTAAPLTQIAAAAAAAGGTDPAQQQAHLKSAASAVLNNPSRAATSMKVAEGAAGDLAKRAMEEKRGVPVLMQVGGAGGGGGLCWCFVFVVCAWCVFLGGGMTIHPPCDVPWRQGLPVLMHMGRAHVVVVGGGG
jgi:hypothetical protein